MKERLCSIWIFRHIVPHINADFSSFSLLTFSRPKRDAIFMILQIKHLLFSYVFPLWLYYRSFFVSPLLQRNSTTFLFFAHFHLCFFPHTCMFEIKGIFHFQSHFLNMLKYKYHIKLNFIYYWYFSNVRLVQLLLCSHAIMYFTNYARE